MWNEVWRKKSTHTSLNYIIVIHRQKPRCCVFTAYYYKTNRRQCTALSDYCIAHKCTPHTKLQNYDTSSFWHWFRHIRHIGATGRAHSIAQPIWFNVVKMQNCIVDLERIQCNIIRFATKNMVSFVCIVNTAFSTLIMLPDNQPLHSTASNRMLWFNLVFR